MNTADPDVRMRVERAICRKATAVFENTGRLKDAIAYIAAQFVTFESLDVSSAQLDAILNSVAEMDSCAHQEGRAAFLHVCAGCTALVNCDQLDQQDGEGDGVLVAPLLCKPCASTSQDGLIRAHVDFDNLETLEEWHLMQLLQPLLTRDIREYERTGCENQLDAKAIVTDLKPRLNFDAEPRSKFFDEVFGCEIAFDYQGKDQLNRAFSPSIDAIHGVVVYKMHGSEESNRGLHIEGNVALTSRLFNLAKNVYSLTTTLPWMQAMSLDQDTAVAVARCRNASDLIAIRDLIQRRQGDPTLKLLEDRLDESAARDSHVPYRVVDRLEQAASAAPDKVVVAVIDGTISDARKYYGARVTALASKTWTDGRQRPEVVAADVSQTRYPRPAGEAPQAAAAVEQDVEQDVEIEILRDVVRRYNPGYVIPLTPDGAPCPFPQERGFWSRTRLIQCFRVYAVNLWNLGDRAFRGQHDPAIPLDNPLLAARNLLLLANIFSIILGGGIDATTGLHLTSAYRSSPAPTKMTFGAFIAGEDVREQTGFRIVSQEEHDAAEMLISHSPGRTTFNR